MQTKLKAVFFPIIAILLGFFLITAVLELVFRILPTSDSLKIQSVNAANPIPRFKENRDVIWSRGANFSIVTQKHVNNYGFLNDQDYRAEDQSPLLAIIGDSYVEAAQVANKDAMHGILSEKVSNQGRIYSFGASGSQLPTYLAYAKYVAETFNPDGFVFVIIGNDFDESLVKYKSSPTFHYFSNKISELELIRHDYSPSLFKNLMRQSALVRYLTLNLSIKANLNTFIGASDPNTFVGNTDTSVDEERLSDSKRAVVRFFEKLPLYTNVQKNQILFVIDGMRPHIYDTTELEKATGSYFDVMRNYFIKYATNEGYEVIDMQPAFISQYTVDRRKFEFSTDAHWNKTGHALVAKKIQSSSLYKALF